MVFYGKHTPYERIAFLSIRDTQKPVDYSAQIEAELSKLEGPFAQDLKDLYSLCQITSLGLSNPHGVNSIDERADEDGLGIPDHAYVADNDPSNPTLPFVFSQAMDNVASNMVGILKRVEGKSLPPALEYMVNKARQYIQRLEY